MAELKLNVKFATAPASAVATIPKFKFDKVGIVDLTHDDNSPGFGLIHPYLRTKYYTDGCSNQIPYSHSLALINILNGKYTVQQALQFIADGCDLTNHTYTHGGNPVGSANKYDDIMLNDAGIRNALGYAMGFTVIPESIIGYSEVSADAGYKGITSTGDEAFGPTYQALRVYQKFPDLTDPWVFLAIVRDFNDEWPDPTSQAFVKSLIDDLFTGKREYVMVGTHSEFETDPKLAGYKDYLDYIFNTAADRLLVCPMREHLDYREMQVQPITQTLVGDTLTISINTDSVSDINRWKDLSFKISSDQTIQSVSIEGFDSYSFNPSTGLVNGFKQKTNWGNVIVPDPDQTLYIPHGRFIAQ